MTIHIHVHPRANRNEIVEAGGDLHAYVTAPPLENKANIAVRDLIAKRFDVAKSEVTLVRGARSPIKEFEI